MGPVPGAATLFSCVRPSMQALVNSRRPLHTLCLPCRPCLARAVTRPDCGGGRRRVTGGARAPAGAGEELRAAQGAVQARAGAHGRRRLRGGRGRHQGRAAGARPGPAGSGGVVTRARGGRGRPALAAGPCRRGRPDPVSSLTSVRPPYSCPRKPCRITHLPACAYPVTPAQGRQIHRSAAPRVLWRSRWRLLGAALRRRALAPAPR